MRHSKSLSLFPVSSEISDLCEISDLLLQSNGIKFGDYIFNVCCVT